MIQKFNNIANSRLLYKVAVNADAAAQKFIDAYIMSPNNLSRIEDEFNKITSSFFTLQNKEQIYNDQFVGTITCQSAIVGGNCTIQLFNVSDLDKFIKNAGIKKDLSFKDKFKSLFSDKAKEKIKNEVLNAIVRKLEENMPTFANKLGERMAYWGVIKGLNRKVSSEEGIQMSMSNQSLMNKMTDTNYNTSNLNKGIVYLTATIPIFKINLNESNYLRRQTQLTQEQLNQIYTPEFQKILKSWMIKDINYFNQIKNYLTNNLKNISKKMQYEKMSGNDRSIR